MSKEKKKGDKKETKEERSIRLRKVKRRRKPSIKYFHEDHEEAVREFLEIKDGRRRDFLYESLIRPGFTEIIENIVNTFKFHYLPNIEDLKGECLTDITMKIGKFDPNRGSKAFSYFSVMTKNWFIIKAKKGKKIRKIEVCLDDILENYQEFSKNLDNFTVFGATSLMEREDFIKEFMSDLETWSKGMRKNTNLWRVFNAIKKIFKNTDSLDSNVINRNAIYTHLRKVTKLKDPQISNALYRLRRRYKAFSKKYTESD